MKNTYMQKKEEVVRNWYVLDAEEANLGRLASKAAHILRGKHKATFTPHVDCGDNVIVVNVFVLFVIDLLYSLYKPNVGEYISIYSSNN